MKSNLCLSSLRNSVKYLDCDEHINAAVELGIIEMFQAIYCQKYFADTDGGKHLKASIVDCKTTNPTIDCLRECPSHKIRLCHMRLDDMYINSTGLEIPVSEYILDIDLDYFQIRTSLQPLRY